MEVSVKKIFIYLFAGILFLAMHCSSTQKSRKTGESSEKPAEQKTAQDIIREMASRETTDLSLHAVQNYPDVQLLSSGEITVKTLDKNTLVFSIPIGAETPVECTIFYGNQSPAYVLRKLFEKVRGNTALEMIGLKEVSTGVSSRVPYLYTEIEYLTLEKLYGTVKAESFSSLGFVLMCYHDELGYRKTFQTSAESFAASEKIQNHLKKIKKYLRRDVQEIQFNEQTIGFTENFLFEGNNGILNYYSVSNYLIFSENNMIGGELIEDLYINESDGSINSGKYYSYKNDTSEYELSLKETAPLNYKVEGKFRDQEFSKEFNPDGKIMPLDYFLDNLVTEKKDPKPDVLKIYQYHASYPDQLPLSELKILSLDEAGGKFSFLSGPLRMELSADQAGISLVSVVNDRASMITKRIFSE